MLLQLWSNMQVAEGNTQCSRLVGRLTRIYSTIDTGSPLNGQAMLWFVGEGTGEESAVISLSSVCSIAINLKDVLCFLFSTLALPQSLVLHYQQKVNQQLHLQQLHCQPASIFVAQVGSTDYSFLDVLA